MGLTASSFAADMEENMTITTSSEMQAEMSTTSANMELKTKVETKLDSKISNLTQEKIDIILERVDAYRANMSTMNMSTAKTAAYDMVLDTLVEILKERETMMMEMSDMDELPTIAEGAMANEDFSTLVTAVQAAGLVDTLNGTEMYTVFAPYNSAFDMLDAGTLEMLLEEENMEMLKEILTYHVVAGTVMAADIEDGMMVETVNGEELMFTIVDGKVMINGDTTVTMADMSKSNGVVHGIDMVLMPEMDEDMEDDMDDDMMDS